MPYLTNIAFLRSKEGKAEELGEHLLALVIPTRNEEGNIFYHIHQSETDLNQWLIYETWRSGEDFKYHLQTPYVTSFLNKSINLLEGEIEIQPYRMLSIL